MLSFSHAINNLDCLNFTQLTALKFDENFISLTITVGFEEEIKWDGWV